MPCVSDQFDDELFDAAYLESGDLLLAANDRLLLVSPGTGKSLATWPFGALRIRMDAKQSMVVLSVNIPQYGSEEPATSAGLFRWPEMQLLHEIFVDGHYVAKGTLSPDANHLALYLTPIGKGITRLAIFDTETGKEIARCKAHQLVDILFLDNQTLAMARNMTSTNVPVERWRWHKEFPADEHQR